MGKFKLLNNINKRSLKYGSNAVILIVAVVVIAILVNLLVGMADLKLDLTTSKLFSLSDVTKSELENLDKDVEIIGLFDDGKISDEKYRQVTDLLNLYAKYPRVTVKYIDPERNPGIIKDLDPDETMNLRRYDFIVKSNVNGNEKKRKLEYYDLFDVQLSQSTFETYVTGSNAEQGFTGAIRYVTSEVTPTVYFTEDHDEIDMDYEYTNLKNYLERNNYLVKKLNLISTDKIPEDAELVIIASPKKDITMAEREVLAEYLDNGGKALFMFDYLANDPSFDEFNKLFSKYNVEINYDKVKETDENRCLPNDPNTIVLDVKSNSIFPQSFRTLISNSRSVSILKNEKEYVKTTSLMATSDKAVGEMVSKERGNDLKGPLDIAVAVEYTGGTKASRIIVMGNASFISDTASKTFGNYYNYSIIFFLQSMNWLIDKHDEIIVPTKNYDTNVISITQQQATIVGGALIVILPLLILGTGMAVFLRRRHL